MIAINLPLPISILYFFTACKLIIQGKYTPVLTFHWDSGPHALLIHRDITPVYLLPTRDIYISVDMFLYTVRSTIVDHEVFQYSISGAQSYHNHFYC